MEIVFSFDTTGSMANCIQEVHRNKIFYSKGNMKSITKINDLSNLLVRYYKLYHELTGNIMFLFARGGC